METQPAGTAPARVMISGLSESVEGFPALVHVPEEVAKITKLYAGSDKLINRDFQRSVLGAKLGDGLSPSSTSPRTGTSITM